jgi:hypothetical protein
MYRFAPFAMRKEKEIFRIINTLDQPSSDRFARKIEAYKNECGCKLGGIFAVSTIAISILYSLLFFNPVSVFAGIKMILWSAMAIVAAGLGGKFIGIGVARIKLMALYRELLRLHH